MSWVNNGWERSLTVSIVKYANGVQTDVDVYQGLNDTNFLYHSGLPAITQVQLAQLSDSDYTIRLDAFKAWVSTMEPDLNWGTDIVAGFEPELLNEDDCGTPTPEPPEPTYTYQVDFTNHACELENDSEGVITYQVDFTSHACELEDTEGGVISYQVDFTAHACELEDTESGIITYQVDFTSHACELEDNLVV